MKTRIRPLISFLLLGILTFLTVGILLFMWMRYCGTPPSDAVLVKQFVDHHSEFEKLRMMLHEDGMISVEIDHPPKGMSEKRYMEYVALLKTIGASSAQHYEGEYYFLIYRWGFASCGWGIAVESLDTPPDHQIESMDDFKNTPDHIAYRHLSEKWYLWIKDL